MTLDPCQMFWRPKPYTLRSSEFEAWKWHDFHTLGSRLVRRSHNETLRFSSHILGIISKQCRALYRLEELEVKEGGLAQQHLGEQVRHFSRHEEAVHDFQKRLVLHLRFGQYERRVLAFLATLLVQHPGDSSQYNRVGVVRFRCAVVPFWPQLL